MKKRVDFTLFDKAIMQAIFLAGSGGNDRADLSKDVIKDKLLNLPDPFMVAFNKHSKVVSNISVLIILFEKLV